MRGEFSKTAPPDEALLAAGSALGPVTGWASAPGGVEPFHLILDDIKDYAVYMVSLDGHVSSWNLGAKRLKGFTAAEAIGKTIDSFFTLEDVLQGRPAWERQRAFETGVYQGEGVRVRKDGSRFDADVTLRLVLDGAGLPRCFVKVTRDISERKHLEKVERERADFEKQLLGIVSHDLRNPLNAILMSAKLISRRGELNASQAGALERMVASAHRAERLIRDLLDFTQARLGSGLAVDPKLMNLHDFTHEVLEEIALVHPSRPLVLEELADGWVRWDGDRMAQVLTNLLSNAVKHGEAQGPVTVRTSSRGENVEIQVHNGGEPIPAGLLPHLFERLTHGTRKGGADGSIGLGLFIVHLIVEAHGGTIDVSSTQELGTTFTVRVPRTC